MLFSGLFYYSCKKDTYNINLDADDRDLRPIAIEAPIAKVNVEMKRWLDSLIVDGNINVFGKGEAEEEGVLYVEFNHTASLDWEDMKNIPNVSRPLNFPVSGLTSAPLETPLSYTENIKLISRADAVYESVTFAGGRLGFNLVVPSGLTGTITFEIPELTFGGQSRTYTFDFPGTTNIYAPLAGGTIQFGATPNTITLKSTITINSNTPPASGNLQVVFALENLNIQYADGYFGKIQTGEDNNEFGFGLFSDLNIENHFEFGNIILEANVENPIGAPFDVDVENIRFYKGGSDIGGLTVGADNSINLDISSAQTSGTPGTGSRSINGSNSNIETLISQFPDKITFNLNGIANKGGSSATTDNFIGRESMLDIDFALKFPFHFKSSSYERTDTISFDASDLFGDIVEKETDVHSFELTFKCANRLPFDAGFTLYAIDEAGRKIGENLYQGDETLKAADPENAENSQFSVNLTGEQIIRYMDEEVTHLILRTYASTTGGGNEFVKIYDDSGLTINVSLKGKVNIPTNLFE